jgi:hypothetical protein
MRRHIAGLVIVLVWAAGLLLACGGPAPAPAGEEQPEAPQAAVDGAALLEDRCAAHHALERATSAQKTREEWVQTVTRMVRKGAKLDAGEQEALITYLAETYGP